VSTARLGDGVTVHAIAASAAECQALARRFGLVALDRLIAEVRLSRRQGSVRLEATLEADTVATCVVTLEPFRSHVADSVTLVFQRPAGPSGGAVDVGEDDVEPLIGEEIDIGEAAAQQLSLALDPYPRSPGAALPDTAASREDSPDPAAKPHPFARLAALRKE
jgi:uncharacterized metal-binding protein YceD (DUF177 family)